MRTCNFVNIKRSSIIFVLILTCFSNLNGQNANRKGFFIEAGLGKMIGNNVRVNMYVENDLLYDYFASGYAFDIGCGYRFPTSSHWACEIKADLQSPFSYINKAFTIRILPFGVRFVSGELWKNLSIYSHINVGYALCRTDGDYDYIGELLDYYCHGLSGSIGLGINITPRFYIEGFCNPQGLFGAFGKKGHGFLIGGMAGVMVGWRL